ncbi:SAM-dependent methyltransferase [Streptomyces sp. NPDC001893]|uniref:SAM-dependent methyltransferase n=1 Tax=Streptomyces sp. NPDC001893 TaxID=3154530 RepID=UPI00332A96FE
MGDDAPQHDSAEQLHQRIDSSRAHPARVYDVFLGGKDNYAADREAAAAALAANPRGYLDVRHNRDFMRRSVNYLTREAGLRQFLDIGTGLPTQENVHQVAQRIAPEARIVYVDNDPVVLAHARALLASGPQGATAYIDADLRDPAKILQDAASTIDLDAPIALGLVAILHFIEDAEAYDIVRALVDALPVGSALFLSHLTSDMNAEKIAKVAETYHERGFTFVLRSADEVRRFFTENGLEIVEPGIVPAHHWRPDHVADHDTDHAAAGRDEAYVASLDPIERTMYRDINDVTDDDINVYAAVAFKR